MKKLLFLLTFLLGTFLHAQDYTPIVLFNWCKKAEVELLTGDCFPANHVIIGTGNFLKSEVGKTLAELSPKQIKTMQKLAVHFHSCKVFIDFDQIVGAGLDENGQPLVDRYLSYYVICPLYYIRSDEME